MTCPGHPSEAPRCELLDTQLIKSYPAPRWIIKYCLLLQPLWLIIGAKFPVEQHLSIKIQIEFVMKAVELHWLPEGACVLVLLFPTPLEAVWREEPGGNTACLSRTHLSGNRYGKHRYAKQHMVGLTLGIRETHLLWMWLEAHPH